MEGFLENAGKLTDPGDRNNIEAVLQVSVAANQGLYNEVRRDWVMWDALKELMREEIEEEKKNAVEIAVDADRDDQNSDGKLKTNCRSGHVRHGYPDRKVGRV